jgi:hypothetical protein
MDPVLRIRFNYVSQTASCEKKNGECYVLLKNVAAPLLRIRIRNVPLHYISTNNMVSETLCSGSSYCNNYVFLDSGVPGLAFAAVWRVHSLADWSELALLPRSKQKGILIPSMLL